MKDHKDIKIIIAEDHEIFLDVLKNTITRNYDIQVIATAVNGQDLLQKLTVYKPDLILLDIRMPIMDGMEAAIEIKKNYPNIKIIMLTMHSDLSIIKEMMDIGIHGYILKNSNIKEIINSIEKVLDGELYYGTEVKESLIEEVVEKPMTDNIVISRIEKEILSLVCAGNTDEQISQQLELNITTIELYLKKLYIRIKLDNRDDLIRYAYENNLIEI